MHANDRKSWYEGCVKSSGANTDVEFVFLAIVVDAAIWSERGYTSLDESDVGLLYAL